MDRLNTNRNPAPRQDSRPDEDVLAALLTAARRGHIDTVRRLQSRLALDGQRLEPVPEAGGYRLVNSRRACP